MQLDNKKLKMPVSQYMDSQNRFKKLVRENKEKAARFYEEAQIHTDKKHEAYIRTGMDDEQLLDRLKKKLGENVSTEKALIL